MRARRVEPSRRAFLSGAAALSAYFWIPKPVKGYTPAEMRAMAVGGTVKPGISKWDLDTPALVRRSRQDGEEHRDDAGGAEEVRASQPAAREDAQVRGHREVSARHRIDRHLLRQAERGRGAWSPRASTRS